MSVRERLRRASPPGSQKAAGALDIISDLIGSVADLPADLSARKGHYLKATGYGGKHSGGRRISRRAIEPK